MQVVGGVPFLHLADASGWVFCEHPETGKKLLQPITEESSEESIYPASQPAAHTPATSL